MGYKLSLKGIPRDSNIIVVGCGGTGGFVAEGLCRLLGNSDKTLVLVDYDRVEPHNLRRQNFFEGDLGKFKSQVLSERLSRRYGRKIAYCVYPFSRDLIRDVFARDMYHPLAQGIVIGCVDNAAARRELAENTGPGSWWIDSGNGHQSGQVLIGNTEENGNLRGAFRPEDNTVYHLPSPAVQLPSLLIPPTGPPAALRDCAEAVEADGQSPVINQAMATLVLDFVYLLLQEQLTWMGAYIDLGAGTLKTVPAEPETVARMTGVKVDTLVEKVCPKCGKRHD